MFRYKIIIVLLLFSGTSLWSQTHTSTDFTNYTFEEYPLGNVRKLDVRSKHAQINLRNWNKDSISIETNIEILSDKPNLSAEMLNEITIFTVFYANTLQLKTSLATDFNRTIPYKITYTIYYPKQLGLNIENSHGSVNIAQVQGGVVADISYCDINFDDIIPKIDSLNNHIKLLHCTGRINRLESAQIQIENSDIDILRAKNIKGNTAYSIVKLDTVSNYNASSNVDNLKIANCQIIKLQAINSMIDVSDFGTDALFECKKGTLSIANPTGNFQRLRVNNNQCPTQIQLNPNIAYSINGDIENGSFYHPQIDSLQVTKDNANISISGEVGSMPSTGAKVIVFNRDANIEFH